MRKTIARSIVGKVAAAAPALLIAGAIVLVTSAPSNATKAIARKTKKECESCHVEKGEKALNAAGKKYQAENPE